MVRPTHDPWAVIQRRLAYPDTGCWEWTGALANGYGQIKVLQRRHPVHRLVYEHHVGPIAAGMEIDHLCKNKVCCNPAHLEAVTHHENILRGNSPAAQHARKTHCKHGHEFTPENTRVVGGVRRCRSCRRRRNLEYKARRRAYG